MHPCNRINAMWEHFEALPNDWSKCDGKMDYENAVWFIRRVEALAAELTEFANSLKP